MEECFALHQLLFGLKHDAKLRNHYARQIKGSVTFLLRHFLNEKWGALFFNSKEIAENSARICLKIFF